jgi:hypothetical protein
MSISSSLMKMLACVAAAAPPCACDGGGDGPGAGGPGLPPAAPSNLEARLIATTEAQLQWFPSVDDVGVTGYRVYRDGDAIAEVPSAAAMDSDVPADRESCYTVTALDGDGHESGPSNEACVDPRTTWILRVHASRGELRAVAWSGERFLAVGSENEVLASVDGRAWIRHDKGLGFFASYNDILWDGERFVAVGDSGVATTTDGVDGTSTLLLGNGEMSALAWSGTLYVAVGESGGIYTSPDAMTFTPQTSGTTEWLYDVVWTGEQLVAVGNAGVILTSPDGIAWTQQVSTTTASLDAVAHSDKGFVAVGTAVALTSPDGVSWTAHELAGAYRDVAFVEHLERFVATGFGGSIITSADGATWTEATSLTPQSVLEGIAAGNGTVVVVGTDGMIYSAMDPGVDAWTTRSSGVDLFNVVRVGERLFALGGYGRLLTSTDGVAWSHADTGNRDDILLDVAASDSRYVLAGQSYLVSSADSITWDAREWLGATSACDGVVWTGAQFVAACTGAFRLSPDGIVWEAILLDDYSQVVSDIAWSGSVLVAASSAGMMQSSDGRAWTPVTVPGMTRPRGVVWTGARFVAVGDGGAIAHSQDGATWSAATSGVTDDLTAITWTGDEIVAIGSNGTVLSSPDADTWTAWPRQLDLANLTGVAATDTGRLAVTTRDGEIFTVR